MVDLALNPQEDFIYVPNVFSPNNDGVNDFFQCYPARNVEILEFEMQLFNRWGAKMFETTDVNAGWNGNFKEELLNPGIYVYWIKTKVQACKREYEIFKKGDIAIVR